MVFSHSGSSPSLRNCVTATQDSDGSTIESPARMIRIICTWTARFVFSGLRAVTSEMSCNITHFYRPHIEPTTEMGICHARILLPALHLLQKSPSRFILQIANRFKLCQLIGIQCLRAVLSGGTGTGKLRISHHLMIDIGK